MSTISEHIFGLYNQLVDDEIQPIDETVVDDAIGVINKISVSDADSLFYFLAAMNLLNAAIKTAKHKSQLFYGFIKTRVSKITDLILQNPSFYTDTSVYYDDKQRCMYFEVYGVIFSFHQVQETKLIKNIASKNDRIQWTGIRLQRIAQNIFLYAKQLNIDSDKLSNDMDIQTTNNSNGNNNCLNAVNPNLFPCPDCGKEISVHAKICPQCGNDLCACNELLDGIKEGYSLKISYSGIVSLGKLETQNDRFITLRLSDDKWVKVRTSAIDSVELIDTNEISTESFAQQAETFFLHILELSSIDKETLISTNATITKVEKIGLTIITDSGETVICVKSGIVGYKKKDCTFGKRVYCRNISTNGKCYSSIVEMSYGGLIGFFCKAVSYSRNITQARKSQILSILTYFIKEMTTNPEAFIEIKNFKKKVKNFLGQLDIECDNFSEIDEISEEGTQQVVSVEPQKKEQLKQQLYKTETEQLLEGSGLPQLKVLGKIDLDAIPGKKKNIFNNSSVASTEHIEITAKPSILSSDEVMAFVDKKLPNLSELKCKQLEKELDTLIRNGQKEECLRQSYQIINTSRPTPKYLRSYLDRIVNTEIALDHTNEALQSLAYLIVLTEQQSNINVNSISHLYITMARLYQKGNNREEALKAILYAESVKPNNNAITKLKESIQRMDSNDINNSDSSSDTSTPINGSVDTNDSISKMLLEDVCQEAKRQELLPSNEIIPAEQLFGRAQNKRNDQSVSFEGKAQLFLEAAGAYYNSKQTSTIMYKISVANYARLKGHGMYARFANLIGNDSTELIELQALRDSACSYYVEALEIFNTLGEKDNLRELLLKYLQLSFVTSQIEGNKTPESDWEIISLGKLQEICLKGDSSENLNLLLRTYLVVGSAAEDVWISLINDKSGIGPFRGKCSDSERFKKQAFNILNQINQSTIDVDDDLENFMHSLFVHRNERKKILSEAIQICLSWKFYSFDLSSFDKKWRKVLEYKDLMTNTDIISINSLIEVIEILKPYAGRKENERTRILVRAQQTLLGAQKTIADTTTYYGNTFFSILINNWLKEISRQIEERDARTLPMLNISSKPAFITKDEHGNGVISIVVTNNGDSTAESFYVTATIDGKEYKVLHEGELSSGDCSGESFVSSDFSSLESANVKFLLIAKYQGKDLNPIVYEATYEIESEDVLSDEIDIPWNISNTPEEHIFKGREKELKTLIDHYLSKDRSLTYILYGLTRTGKSSILDYLRNRIDSQILKEDSSKHILAFKWYLNEFPYKNSTSAQFWTWALETNIYDKLTDELADKVDAAYGENGLPPAECLSQIDFCKIVDVLNENNVIPLVTIDEFSFVRLMLKEGLIDATFISTLRNLALTGKACFVYSGTYDIKELPKEKEYIAGQMNNTLPMPINEIEEQYANELIDACPKIIFDERAKTYIRALSGCVPYWIQWICLACGKYAVARKHRHLGFNEVNDVVRVLTGEVQPGKGDTWESLDETNFHNNQVDPENIAEHQLISSISYLNRESTQIERGISMDELKRLWDKYSVNEERRLNMTRALASLKDKKILYSFTDEGREVYRLSVDLFRRWWFVHHKDLDLEFSL